jgi:hypothetical protein
MRAPVQVVHGAGAWVIAHCPWNVEDPHSAETLAPVPEVNRLRVCCHGADDPNAERRDVRRCEFDERDATSRPAHQVHASGQIGGRITV